MPEHSGRILAPVCEALKKEAEPWSVTGLQRHPILNDSSAKPPPYQLVLLANGSHSVHSVAHGETFHPVIGPVAEAEALYVRQLGLVERLERHVAIRDLGRRPGRGGQRPDGLKGGTPVPSYSDRQLRSDIGTPPFALNTRPKLGYLEAYVGALEVVCQRGRPNPAIHPRPAGRPLGAAPGRFSLLPGNSERRGPAQASRHPVRCLFACDQPRDVDRASLRPHLSAPGSGTALRFAHLLPEHPLARNPLLAGFYVGKGHATGEKEETTVAASHLESSLTRSTAAGLCGRETRPAPNRSGNPPIARRLCAPPPGPRSSSTRSSDRKCRGPPAPHPSLSPRERVLAAPGTACCAGCHRPGAGKEQTASHRARRSRVQARTEGVSLALGDGRVRGRGCGAQGFDVPRSTFPIREG